MKLAAGFKLRAEEALRQVRSGGKDALRRFRTPTMSFPVSEGTSDGPTSTDLAPPGRLAAAKKDEGFGLLKMKNILLFPNPVFAEKASVVENRDKVKEQKTPDATMPLDEKSIGTITFDTSKGSTMVASEGVFEAFSVGLKQGGVSFPVIDGQTFASRVDLSGIARGDRVRYSFTPGPTELKAGAGTYKLDYPELTKIEKV